MKSISSQTKTYLEKYSNILWIIGFLGYILVIALISLNRIDINKISELVTSYRSKGSCESLQPGKKFLHCDFQNVDFSGSDLRDINLENLDLRKASFEDAILINVSFKGSNLNDASFKNSYIFFTNFVDTCLLEADFSGAKIHKINHWRGAALVNTNFEGTAFQETVKQFRNQPYRRTCNKNI